MCDKAIKTQGESPALPRASWINSQLLQNQSPFAPGFRVGGFVLVLPVLEV